MFRKNVFYENVTSDDNMLLRDIRVFKKEVSSLFKKFKKDSKSIYGCGESDLCFIFVTYSKISNVLTLSISDGKDYIDGRSIGSPFGLNIVLRRRSTFIPRHLTLMVLLMRGVPSILMIFRMEYFRLVELWNRNKLY